MPDIVIATRGSKLALWQANHIKDKLQAEHGVSVELLIIKTTGDKILDVPLAKVGGKGLFVKEIEEALLDGRAHIAVHSMKDVPAELPEGLTLGVCPPREEPTDTLLSARYATLDDLPQGARLGTSSLRRQSQILTLRPDLDVVSLRGNVDTRLNKLMQGEFDAIIMATAGLKRLGLSAPYASILQPPEFFPAIGQGALGIEYPEDREGLADMLAFLDHAPTRYAVTAERAFLFGLEGGCQVPIAGYATLEEDTVHLTGLVFEVDGSVTIKRDISGSAEDAQALGRVLADEVLAAGAKEILDRVYGNNGVQADN